jgi:membrane-bound serine protease (ClpP class)
VACSAFGAEPAPVYVIPAKDMIERGLVYVIRRGVEQAEAAGASVIIFDMDTPGGRLDATEQIIESITGLKARTVTYVNPNAISAGAIIAMATDEIYMSPLGRIGDAMPIMMSPLPFGQPQELPDSLKEKAFSPTVALIRSAAQRKGHDPRLAEAMVRPEVGYTVDDTVICPPGQLVTLTSEDAARPVGKDKHPLLSAGTVKTLHELIERLGFAGAPIVTVRITAAERLARIIEGFPLSGILLALGLLGIYIEIKTPGFGFPGTAGILLLAVWFWGHHVAGLAGLGEIAIFIVGAGLLLVEILLIPGFGVVGLVGLGMMVTALLMAMIQHYPGAPWHAPMFVPDLEASILNLSLALLLVFFSGLALARFLPGTMFFHRLALETCETRAAGFAASETTSAWVGKMGTAVTPLRPAGIADFGSARMNVVTQGQFVEKGVSVVVTEAQGNRIVVTQTAG